MINEKNLLNKGFTKVAGDEYYISLKNHTHLFVKQKMSFIWEVKIQYDSAECKAAKATCAVCLPKQFEDIAEIEKLIDALEDKKP